MCEKRVGTFSHYSIRELVFWKYPSKCGTFSVLGFPNRRGVSFARRKMIPLPISPMLFWESEFLETFPQANPRGYKTLTNICRSSFFFSSEHKSYRGTTAVLLYLARLARSEILVAKCLRFSFCRALSRSRQCGTQVVDKGKDVLTDLKCSILIFQSCKNQNSSLNNSVLL